jgi:hypothetical protein
MSMNAETFTAADWHFELRFGSLHDPGRAYAFPCDRAGRVALDRMPARQVQSYLRVKERVGRDFAAPVVARVDD